MTSGEVESERDCISMRCDSRSNRTSSFKRSAGCASISARRSPIAVFAACTLWINPVRSLEGICRNSRRSVRKGSGMVSKPVTLLVNLARTALSC